MRRFVLGRLAWLCLTVWSVATLGFCWMGPEAQGPTGWPLWRQYLQFIGPLNLDPHGLFGERTRIWGGVLVGDLGRSLRQSDFSVNEILAQSLPLSLQLAVLALAWGLGLGLCAGFLAALLAGSRLDRWLCALSSLGLALPGFVLASLLLALFGLEPPRFPGAGFGSLRQLALPVLALGVPLAAHVTALARTALREALGQESVRYAVAAGLPSWRIVLERALPAACLPVVSSLAPAAAAVLTGGLAIERLFALPGAGAQFVRSALAGDSRLVLGVTLSYIVLVFVLDTLVGLVHPLLDPRIRLEEL